MYSRNYVQDKMSFMSEIESNQKLKNHFEKIFRKEALFASEYRKNLTLFGVHTNNLVERSFLSIKQKFLERNKVFNAIHLIQSVVLNYDSYIRLGMVNFLNDRKQYLYKAFKNMDRNYVKELCTIVLGKSLNHYQN